MSEDYSQRAFEFEGVRYQMVKTEKGTHMCAVCEARGGPCRGTFDTTTRKPCGGLVTRDGWHYVKVTAKLPEPPAPKSLSLDEILAEQEAKPSSAIEFFGRNTTIQEIAEAESAWRAKMLEECKGLDPKTKYIRDIYPVDGTAHTDANGKHFVRIDVYSVLRAFGVDHPTGHAIKKLLCAGMRGKGDRVQDLTEAKVAIDRAIQEAGI